MRIKKILLDNISFIVGALFIAGSFTLAYLPRNPETLPPTHISNFSVYEDTTASLSLGEVIALDRQFKPDKKPTLFRKRTHSAYWLKFTIDAPQSSGRFLEIASTSHEHIDIYFPGHDVVRAGKKMDVRTLEIKTRKWNFAIPADLSPDAPVYLRVQTSTIMMVPLRVVDTAEMTNHSISETLLFGAFFGMLITIFFVNLFSFVLVRNRIFLIYLQYLFSLILYHFSVHGFLYLIPMPFAVLNAVLWINLGGVGIFMMLFAQQFLVLKKRLPLINLILNIFIIFFVIQTIFGVFFSTFIANKIAYVTGFLVPLIIISSTTWIYFTGYREARFYLLAWCALFTGTLIWSTAAYAEVQIPANYFFIIGTSIDSLLFTLAIFDQIKVQLKEKEVIIEREKYYIDLSRTDSLTGLFNRRYLNDLIKRLEAENEAPIQSAIIMIDLDNFKSINDTYGHPVGDLMLINVSTKIKKHVRKTDIACRYGGDEFLVFLPGANALAAHIIAEGLRQDILSDIISTEMGDKLHQTISIGITESKAGDSFDGCLLRADAALYKAKKEGKNRISVL